MAPGKSSNLGASSSTKTVKHKDKRKQRATTRADDEAKKPRPFQLINFTARPRGSTGTAAPAAVPLHRGASDTATTAFPFPMTGVNGAAPLWSTAATLGAASRAAALTLSSLPASTSANGPAAAAASAAALVLPAATAASGIRPPLVLAQAGAGAGGQLVPLPLHFVGYHPECRASSMLPAPAVGIPLAAALDKIENGTLGRMLSALMPVCNPPLRQHHSKRGPPPPWWPTGSEDWWVPELLMHLDMVAALSHAGPRPAPPVPFAPSYNLKKAQKVAVLVAIVKHLAPDFARIAAAVRHSGKLSVSETDLWHSALNNERAKCVRPVFVLLPQPELQPQGGDGGGGGSPSAAGSVVVHGGNVTASDGCELQVDNLPAGASVSAPADGSHRGAGEVIAAAELVEKEQRSDDAGVGVGVGVVSATNALAGDGRDHPVIFPAGGDGSTHKQGAAVAAAADAPTAGHVRQVAGGPEMTVQPPEQHGGVPGNGVAATAAEDDEVQAPPVVDDDVEGHQWWYNDDELNRMFAEFESFGDVWY